MTKKCMIMGLAALMCGTAYAEPIRTFLTKENRLPRLYQAEVGVDFVYVDMEDDMGEWTSAVPYLRYTPVRDLAVFASLPYMQVDPAFGSKERGIGDAVLGVDFLAFTDLFGYPWIMPHGAIGFATGDEKKGLGAGDTQYLVGMAVGTTVNRSIHFAADFRYQILEEIENVPSVAASVVWDLDEKFSLIAEIEVARLREDNGFGGKETVNPITVLGGMHYQASRSLHFTLQGGAGEDSGADSIIRGRVAYVF
jgi:hypothetical protein